MILICIKASGFNGVFNSVYDPDGCCQSPLDQILNSIGFPYIFIIFASIFVVRHINRTPVPLGDGRYFIMKLENDIKKFVKLVENFKVYKETQSDKKSDQLFQKIQKLYEEIEIAKNDSKIVTNFAQKYSSKNEKILGSQEYIASVAFYETNIADKYIITNKKI
jgi:hypothetical protein